MTLLDGAKTAVKECMGVTKGERVLIITDTAKQNIGQALFDVALGLGAEAYIVVTPEPDKPGGEPTAEIAHFMRQVDVVIAPTKFSLSHTQARKRACRSGARVATMPGITEEMMSKGGMKADFKEIQKSIRKLNRVLNRYDEVHIETKLGTDLTLSTKGREWIDLDTGICHKKGLFTNLPAGELFIAPREGTANGTLVIDGAFGEKLDKPVEVTIADGYATKMTNASKTLGLLKKHGKEGLNVAELGIGMNPKARIIGNVLEDEKVKGTIHVAFGDNSTFGGRVKAGIHLDGIVTKPTVTLDGKKAIMENGKHLIE